MEIWARRYSFFVVSICCIAVAFILFALYWQVIRLLINDWVINENYSHGFFIPIISLYITYAITKQERSYIIEPDTKGLIIIIFALFLLYISNIASEYFIQRLSIILVLIGTILFIFGKFILKIYIFPILYLIFMIPIPAILWNEIAFPLQIFSSFLSEIIIKLLGISIYREGNILHLPGSSLEVIDACSGIRSLTAMLSLSAAFSWFKMRSLSNKYLIFFCSIPITIAANVARLTVTAVLVNFYGARILDGFVHDFSGVFTFFVGFCLLASVAAVIEKSR